MTIGAVAAAQSIGKRRRWEQTNVKAAVMLDWDDVQAVTTRALTGSSKMQDIRELLERFKENGATHLSLPELTIDRLLGRGQLNVVQGASTRRIYLQAKSAALADLVTGELQARLPQLEAGRTKGRGPVISMIGDLPAIAEVGLGFDPAHAELAQSSGLAPVARPIGYSWVQPEMIDRTLNQAAKLGSKLVAFQGRLIPGHEYHIQHTVEAIRRNRLTYAYFRESRHQKGDWFLAKHLAPAGRVMLAHEFDPSELLDEDLHTAAYRWANLAVEAGIRLCSVRFFRILHAADPLESLLYVNEIARALQQAGLSVDPDGPVNLTTVQPVGRPGSLAAVGLSSAGAAGLAADLLPIPDQLKLLGTAAGAVTLASLPYLGRRQPGHDHHHHHGHDHHHHHHHHDGNDQGAKPATAYAQKGLALAATIAFPTAAISLNNGNPLTALAQTTVVGVAAAATVAATTVDGDYLLGIEEYRGYNLDWLVPQGLAASTALGGDKKGLWPWLPLAGVAILGLNSVGARFPPDIMATLDREHRHAHTHHLSLFQQKLGDLKLGLAPRPLRKWSLLAPLGVVAAAVSRRNGQPELAAIFLVTGAAGHVATVTGFRQGQRPLEITVAGRSKSWISGALLAGAIGLSVLLFQGRR
jgi:hypothetical protein